MYLMGFPNESIVFFKSLNCFPEFGSILRYTPRRQIIRVKTRWVDDVVSQAAGKVFGTLYSLQISESQRREYRIHLQLCHRILILPKYFLISFGDHEPGLLIISSTSSSFAVMLNQRRIIWAFLNKVQPHRLEQN